MSRSAFTLLEVLAVVILLTLAMAAAASGIAGASDAAKVRAVVAGVLDLDQRARMSAAAGSRVTMSVEADCLCVYTLYTGEQLAHLPLYASLSVQLLDSDDKPLETVVFDRAGCTPDYRVLVSLGDHTHFVTIAGLTGWSEDSPGATR